MCGTTDSLVKAWHDVSRPFVDTSLGRMATNVATGGLSAPAFATYDISRGADPLKSAAMGAMGYFGGQAGNEWLTGGEAGAVPADGLGDFGDSWGNAAGGGESLGNMGYVPETSVPTFAPSTDTGFLQDTTTPVGNWTPETPFAEVSGIDPSGLGYTPLEDSVGASMDTTGLSKVGDSPGWLSRMTSAATKGMGDAWSAEGIGKSLGNMGPIAIGSGLLDMFSKKNQAVAQMERFNDVQNQISGMYAPGSPEYEALMQQVSRADAAAGRNSQIGPRSVDLAAKIATMKANALSGTLAQQNAMYNNSLTSGAGGLGSLFANWQKANTPRPSTYTR